MKNELQFLLDRVVDRWPVLFGLAMVNLVAMILVTISFSSSCREVGCLGVIVFYGTIALLAVVCIVAAIGWHLSKRGPRKRLLRFVKIGIAVGWLLIFLATR
jgi:hypothetical protein